MDSKLLLTLAELLTECPRCMKTSLKGGSLDISTKEITRTCSCGYTIKLKIEEDFKTEQERTHQSILKG